MRSMALSYACTNLRKMASFLTHRWYVACEVSNLKPNFEILPSSVLLLDETRWFPFYCPLRSALISYSE